MSDSQSISAESVTTGSVAFVSELLEELLLKVSPSPWDVTISQPVSTDLCPAAYAAVLRVFHEECEAKNGDQSELELSSVVRCVPASAGHGGCEIAQLRVAQQFSEMACGHHAMYNILCLTSALRHTVSKKINGMVGSADVQSPDCGECSQSAERRFEALRSSAALWRRYWRTIGKLTAHCEEVGSSSWPWDVKTVRAGLVERTYLRYLLQDDDQLLCAQTFCPMMEIQFGYGHFLMSTEQILQLQQQIDTFTKVEKPSCLAFFLGVLDHWVAAVAVKAPGSNASRMAEKNESEAVANAHQRQAASRRENDNVCLFYMDSKNNDTVLREAKDLLALAVLKENDHKRRKGKPWTAREREHCLQAWEDSSALVCAMSRCLGGTSTMLREYLSFAVDFVVDSYVCHVTPRMAKKVVKLPYHLQNLNSKQDADTDGEEDNSVFLIRLVTWLESYHRPSDLDHLLVKGIKEFGVVNLDKEHSQRLVQWAQKLRGRVPEFEDCGITVVERLPPVLDRLLSLLVPDEDSKL